MKIVLKEQVTFNQTHLAYITYKPNIELFYEKKYVIYELKMQTYSAFDENIEYQMRLCNVM